MDKYIYIICIYSVYHGIYIHLSTYTLSTMVNIGTQGSQLPTSSETKGNQWGNQWKPMA